MTTRVTCTQDSDAVKKLIEPGEHIIGSSSSQQCAMPLKVKVASPNVSYTNEAIHSTYTYRTTLVEANSDASFTATPQATTFEFKTSLEVLEKSRERVAPPPLPSRDAFARRCRVSGSCSSAGEAITVRLSPDRSSRIDSECAGARKTEKWYDRLGAWRKGKGERSPV